MDEIILVDDNDQEVGFIEKHKAHEGGGFLHRAFSIFIMNGKKEMLVQQRSPKKHLWGLYWANACCSHPRRGETLETATHRRLKEELGFDCELREVFSFVYHAGFEKKGAEYELDHVFFGEYSGKVLPDPDEVNDWKWVSVKDLEKSVRLNPETYAPWFKIALPRIIELFA